MEFSLQSLVLVWDELEGLQRVGFRVAGYEGTVLRSSDVSKFIRESLNIVALGIVVLMYLPHRGCILGKLV